MTPAEYKAKYLEYVQSFRRTAALEMELQAAAARMLADAEAPPGSGIDVWGDGTVKLKEECKPMGAVL